MRRSGILLPISSLPNPYGIGTFGKEAYEFVDFLKKANQKLWQILPLGPTSYGDSPYQTFSAFAGNPYFIDLDHLAEIGLLKRNEYEHMKKAVSDKVDYEYIYYNRFEMLRKAHKRFLEKIPADYQAFCQDNEEWLDDYALYMSIKNSFGGISWSEWPKEYKHRDEKTLALFKDMHQNDIAFWQFLQYEFFQEWFALKKYANDFGIQIVGDIPIYVAQDSSDVWSNPSDWQLDDDLLPTRVAGCPPDYFAKTGQLWGNPLYRYDKMEKEGFPWWIRRVQESFKIYDVVRIDHFRGFESYYSIKYGDPTAEFGVWVKGPSMKLFNAINKALGNVQIIAEDLGFLTEEVYELLRDAGYPGMKILQFGFDPYGDSEYMPHNYNKNSVVYPGTHDNMPIKGWFKTLNREQKQYVYDYLQVKRPKDVPAKMIKACLASVSDMAVIPLQDYLELGNEARFNIPSTLGGNWLWRFDPKMVTEELALKIANWTKIYRR